MKTAIIYASNYGTSEKVANMIKDKINGEVEVVNVMEWKLLNLKEIDKVVIGTGIKAGQAPKTLKDWIEKNLSYLKDKKLYFYMCAGMEDEKKLEQQWNANFPKELLDKVLYKSYCGYEYDFDKMNFFEKIIIKMLTKKKESESKIKKEEIEKLVVEINK